MKNLLNRILNSLLEKNREKINPIPATYYPSRTTGALTTKEIEAITTALKSGQELAYLPDFYWVLYNQEDQGRIASIGILKQILSGFADKLWKIDSLCRSKTSLEWTFDWAAIAPERLFPISIIDPEKVWVYGFASFHPNGFFREKAIAGLSGIHTGDEIPFLIIRLNDWVDVVRGKAKQAIEERMGLDSAIHFLKYFPLLKRLEKTGRDTHGSIVGRITALISSDREVMNQGLVAPDPDTRRFSFEIAVNSSKFELSEIQKAILRESIGSIRLSALRAIEKQISFPEKSAFIRRLIDDRFAPVQRLALDILCKQSLASSEDILRVKILSEKSGIRQTARFYLKKSGAADPASIYRNVLAEKKDSTLIGAIRGLGEVGEKKDLDILKYFLESSKIKVLRSTICSIAALDPDNVVGILLPFLSDARPGVSRDAASALTKKSTEINLESLNEISHQSEFLHVQKNIFKILLSADLWVSLPFILEAHRNKNVVIQEMAKKGLERWLIESNRYFIQPSKEQKGKAKASYIKYSSILDKKTKDILEFILR